MPTDQRPFTVETIEHLVIPTSDGRELSARVWRPVTDTPVPVILEYIPYRKRDFTRGRDEPMHGWFAEQGYVAVRLDMAGSGESRGVMVDEYALQEQDDAVDAIAWLAAQAWCNGSVGMIGKSWGGFNSLQVAARRPPALKAIVPVCATDDRFGDDVHFMGGNLLVDGIDWGAAFQTFLPRSPDPVVLGEAWREAWDERLAGLELPLETWLRHQRRDDYWKHGSICEDYSSIEAATLLIGGWVDGYRTAMLRMAADLPGPTRCILGPWAHLYPHIGEPGPAIGFLQEVVRWFDHWLKGEDNGVMDTPELRAWIQDSAVPDSDRRHSPGRWVGEDWPSPHVAEREWHLTDTGLSTEPGDLTGQELPYELSVGQFAGDWGGFALPHEQAPDQRRDDALSWCVDSAPLDEPLEVLGSGSVRLRVTSDRPVAMLAVRLGDVRPDGTVAKVAHGLLNLTHRDGSEEPRPLTPGEPYDVVVRLSATGYRFPAGHRLRVAVSPSYWPIAWPSPEPTRVRVLAGSAVLPALDATESAAVSFEEPVMAPGPEIVAVGEGQAYERLVTFDVASNTVVKSVSGGVGAYAGDGLNLFSGIGWAMEYRIEREQHIALDDPASARTRYQQEITYQRGDWSSRVRTDITLASTTTDWLLTCDQEVFEGDDLVLSRSWSPVIPRDLM